MPDGKSTIMSYTAACQKWNMIYRKIGGDNFEHKSSDIFVNLVTWMINAVTVTEI